MCGRYALYIYLPIVADFFRVRGKVPDVPPRYNIAPSQDIVIVRQTGGAAGRELALARWGFVPAWSKDPSHLGAAGIAPPINARSETVDSKPAFRDAFRHRRCLVPADGFYEWKAAPASGRGRGGKRPYFVTVGSKPFAMAGLWEHWSPRGGDGHEPFDSCVILTTTPNTMMASLHDRMPVILPPEEWDRWLASETSPEEARAMLRPIPDAGMSMRPVSTRVNSPRMDDPACIEAVGEGAEPARPDPPSLFGGA